MLIQKNVISLIFSKKGKLYMTDVINDFKMKRVEVKIIIKDKKTISKK
jgi:hypothetical protein